MSADKAFQAAYDFTFETHQLRCRLLDSGDHDLYVGLYNSAEMMRFISEPLTEDAASKSFHHALQHAQRHPLQRLFMVVERKTDQVALGILGISSLNWQEPSAEYGLMLSQPGQGKGYALEVTKACLVHLTHGLGLKRVWVDIAEENQAALKVARMADLKANSENARIHEYSIL